MRRLTHEGCGKDIDRFLKEIGTDYLDIVLMHCKIERIIGAAKDKGKGTIAMKVLGQDDLASDPEKAIRFVVETDCVDAMTIGYLSHDEMKECVEIVGRFRK